ncbi:hypothetical protein [Streptomyces sp. MNU103]|uniref:hypothetical protein n=1 Tax=Streptomyces sp. MNU103 TaxID=2560024 RepID=UPI003FCFB3BD
MFAPARREAGPGSGSWGRVAGVHGRAGRRREGVDGGVPHAPENLDPGRAVHPSHWFVRSEPIPSVAFSWAFFEEFGLLWRGVVRVPVPGGRGGRGVGSERVEEFLAGWRGDAGAVAGGGDVRYVEGGCGAKV